MILVSQDGFFRFEMGDNTIFDPESPEEIYVSGKDNTYALVGKYETGERASVVLQNIVKAKEEGQQVYYMPNE